MRFRTTIVQSGPTATGIRVPEEIVAALGAGKRPPVLVAINGYQYRSSVAVMGGSYMVALSAENRAGARVAGGTNATSNSSLTSSSAGSLSRQTWRRRSTPTRTPDARLTGFPIATSRGTSCKSAARRPTRRGGVASSSRSRPSARAAFADDREIAVEPDFGSPAGAIEPTSVQVPLPIGRHSSSRARHGLIERAVIRRCQIRGVHVIVFNEIPEPVFVRLEAAGH